MGEVAQISQDQELAPEVQQGPQFKGEAAQKRIRQLVAELKELRGFITITDEPLTEHQQKWFNRAFAKREAKLKAAHDLKMAATVADLLEVVSLAYRLLKKCDDRLPRPDAREIEVGLLEITNEYAGN